MEKKLYNIFSSEKNKCLSLHQMRAYQAGNLSKYEQHTVEKHILDCPLCAEALEGIQKQISPAATQNNITYLVTALKKRSKPHVQHSRYKTSGFSSLVAASLLLFISLLTFLLLEKSYSPKSEQMAESTEQKKSDSTIKPVTEMSEGGVMPVNEKKEAENTTFHANKRTIVSENSGTDKVVSDDDIITESIGSDDKTLAEISTFDAEVEEEIKAEKEAIEVNEVNAAISGESYDVTSKSRSEKKKMMVNDDDQILDLNEWYTAQQYDMVIEYGVKIVKKDDTDYQAMYLIANSALKLENKRLAIKWLNQLHKAPLNEYTFAATMALSRLLVANAKNAEAIEVLQLSMASDTLHIKEYRILSDSIRSLSPRR